LTTQAKTRRATMTMAQAFDEWTRKYYESPERFGHLMASVKTVLAHKKKSVASDDGNACEALLRGLMKNGKKHWKKRGI